MLNLKGNIHSIETFGTLDGPGIRYVLFMQGCNYKCLYCHNPDTWSNSANLYYTPNEMFENILKYKTYYDKSNGGLTVSGGEPLIQAEFITELFRLCKKNNIHTALDTNGSLDISSHKLDELIKLTDLFLLDIKHVDSEKHIKLTGSSNELVFKFLNYLGNKKAALWIRYVVVPGLTDSIEDVLRLSKLLSKYKNIENIEVLPFHKIGEYKWESLNFEYKLKDFSEPSPELINEIKNILGIAKK